MTCGSYAYVSRVRFFIYLKNTQMYSTELAIKSEAWLTTNPYITSAIVQTMQIRAYSIIQSTLANIYTISELVPSNNRFFDSPASALLSNIETLLSAGYLLMKSYSVDDIGRQEIAKDKINEAYSIMNSIASQKMRLFAVDMTEFSKQWSKQMWPTISKITTDPIFTTLDKH